MEETTTTISDWSDSTRHNSPYRITHEDRYGPPNTSSPFDASHSCPKCQPIMVVAGVRNSSTHVYPFDEVIAELEKTALPVEADQTSNQDPSHAPRAHSQPQHQPCAFLQYCVYLLDIQWGRPKSGQSLISRIKQSGPDNRGPQGLALHVSTVSTTMVSPHGKVSHTKQWEVGGDTVEKVTVSVTLKGKAEFSRSATQVFKVFAEEDSAAASFFSSRPVQSPLRSFTGELLPQLLSRIYTYRDEVLASQHSRLGRPSRLIDLGPDPDVFSLRLTAIDKEWMGRYTCLSYCWGGDQPFKATTFNLTTLSSESGFAYQDLPQTLRDACLVTKLLGERYIWIDALCILQNDEADKATEIPKMRDIYRGALLTITASRARSATEGFLHHRDNLIADRRVFTFPFGRSKTKYTDEEFRQLTRDIRANTVIGSMTLQQAQIENQCVVMEGTVGVFMPKFTIIPETPIESLQCRAWAFQERLLSSRVLDFASFQTSLQDEFMKQQPIVDGGWVTNLPSYENLTKLWEIIRQDNVVYSGRPGSLMDKLNVSGSATVSHRINDKYPSRVWATIVREYTKLGLSVPSDKLAALEGLAEWFGSWTGVSTTASFQHHQKDTVTNPYLAGIWRDHLPVGLMWSIDSHMEPRSARPRPWRAPSWTWACVDWPASIPHAFGTGNPDEDSDIKIVTASVIEADVTNIVRNDLYGPVSDGYIVIEAPIFPVTSVRAWHQNTGDMFSADLDGARFGSVIFDANSDDETYSRPGDSRDGSIQAWCVQIMLERITSLMPNSPDPRLVDQPAGILVLEVPDQQGTFTRIGRFDCELRSTEPRRSFEELQAWRATFETRRIRLI